MKGDLSQAEERVDDAQHVNDASVHGTAFLPPSSRQPGHNNRYRKRHMVAGEHLAGTIAPTSPPLLLIRIFPVPVAPVLTPRCSGSLKKNREVHIRSSPPGLGRRRFQRPPCPRPAPLGRARRRLRRCPSSAAQRRRLGPTPGHLHVWRYIDESVKRKAALSISTVVSEGELS